MTPDDLSNKILTLAMSFVDYCCEQQECTDNYYSELELETEISDSWVRKIANVKENVQGQKYRFVFACFEKLGRDICDGQSDFSEFGDTENYYEYEVEEDFCECISWCGDIHNETNGHCAYVNLSKTRDLMNHLDGNLFLYLWLVSRPPALYGEGKKYIITDQYKGSNERLTKDELRAIIKFEMILKGDILKAPQKYEKSFLYDSLGRNYNCLAGYSVRNEAYNQIENLFDVLSDYHACKGILDKFLKLYHVYEELTIRMTLVKYSKQTGLTARDLADFHNPKPNELKNLVELIKAMLMDSGNIKNCDSGLLNELKSIWNQMHQETRDYLDNWYNSAFPDNNRYFSQFRVKDLQQMSEYIGYIVYQTRCRIVHNKATEFHLSYQKLDVTNLDALENYMLPMMELLCAKTLAEIPDFIRYDTNKIEIKLY